VGLEPHASLVLHCWWGEIGSAVGVLRVARASD
jgi:hypothetical protein